MISIGFTKNVDLTRHLSVDGHLDNEKRYFSTQIIFFSSRNYCPVAQQVNYFCKCFYPAIYSRKFDMKKKLFKNHFIAGQ